MSEEDKHFIKRYEELLDKGYCDCNEMNCIDNNSPRRILNIVKNLQNQLQQKENIIKELNDKIEDDKMIIEGNWGCIDSLRKDYNLQKNIIKEVREYIEEHIKYECDDAFNGKRFYSYHLYDFDKKELLEILDKEVN